MKEKEKAEKEGEREGKTEGETVSLSLGLFHFARAELGQCQEPGAFCRFCTWLQGPKREPFSASFPRSLGGSWI